MGNFWSVGTGGTAAIPKRNFRFLVKISKAAQSDGAGATDAPVWIAKTTQLPNLTVGEAKVHFVNHEFKYPGKVTYADLQITLIEAVDPNTSFRLLKMFSDSGYKNPSNIINVEDAGDVQSSIIFKDKAVMNVELTHLGAGGTAGAGTNNVYTLMNAWVKNITLPQSLDYSNEEVSDVQITFAYDYFTLRAGTDTGEDGSVGGGFLPNS